MYASVKAELKNVRVFIRRFPDCLFFQLRENPSLCQLPTFALQELYLIHHVSRRRANLLQWLFFKYKFAIESIIHLRLA
jgi:hypothetical protein